MLDDGVTVAQVTAGWEDEARMFEERRGPYLLYT
jgi:hypothetical protein